MVLLKLPELADLEHPIALRREYIFDRPTTLHIEKHYRRRFFRSSSDPGEDVTVSKWPPWNSRRLLSENKLFGFDVKWHRFAWRGFVRDASGLPLYDFFKTGLTQGSGWHAQLPGQGERGEDEAMLSVVPRVSYFTSSSSDRTRRQRFDVTVRNCMDGGKEAVLEVRGRDLYWKEVHIYAGNELVVIATRADDLSGWSELEFKVEVGAGLDVSLASMIVLVLLYSPTLMMMPTYQMGGMTAAR